MFYPNENPLQYLRLMSVFWLCMDVGIMHFVYVFIDKNLSISPKAVSTYRSRILEKLDLETNSDIIHYAIDYKLED